MNIEKLIKALDDESNEVLLNFTTEKIRLMNLNVLKELHLSKKDTQDLLNKLVISKKIMEKHNAMGRNSNSDVLPTKSPMVKDYQPIQGNYNLPSDLMN